MISSTSLVLVNLAAFVLCVAFLSYVVVILGAYWRIGRAPEAASPEPFEWHVLVPCLDEELVIGGSVEALVADHPQVHVWCIDDHSSDGTGRVLAQLAERHDTVHVLSRRLPAARQGKGEALNAGWAAVRAWRADQLGQPHQPGPRVDDAQVLVGVVDADGRLSADALGLLAGPRWFGDPTIGAVQVAVRMSNRSTAPKAPADAPVEGATAERPGWLRRLLVDLQDLEFVGPIGAMQALRQHTGSVAMGGNGQFTRLSVLDAVAAEAGTPWHGALLEDFELGIHVLLAGHRTAYCHHAEVAQEGLVGVRALVRQRSRWAQGAMQCRRYLRPVLASRELSNAAAFEISYFLVLPWLQLFGTLVYAASYVVLAWYVSGAAGGSVDGSVAEVLPVIAVAGIGPFLVWGFVYRWRAEPSTGRGRAFVLGLANWAYSCLHHVATWWAFARVVAGRHDWKKTARGAPAASTAGAPVPSPRPG